ncbi:PREDICTED: uncharacterized protein LOC100636571 isoform X2 [Amphimedon queenslandica]|uniref:Coiled-coil domain-containing protein 24 n=1 Tax=Amphimedon queenslandica TaxID=400682 RepID=A0A1X7V9Q6_AMPQE|nr:PREDICTED: uncharacterized protein LOC100636571 isoform X2 [Amphimedon queenslandica]|eukprot:XP_003385160.1 PREDICTED: uncharacterized protein LOC100636571 isoform X2 [Amphimedon queenslandica]
MADNSRCSSVNSDAFELPASTWMVIQSCCPQKEANEVKRAIGQSLIEEACDLHTEASLLLEIWRQMREEADPGRPHDGDTPARLADPPGVRDKLIQEIKFLVSYLQQRNSTSPVVRETLKSPVITYVQNTEEHRSSCSRPSTSSDKSSRYCDTPLAFSNSSSVTGLLESTSSLSIQDVDESIASMRNTVREEIDQRHRDIDLLQSYIDSELSYQKQPIPTIKDLQSVSQNLEKEFLDESKIINQMSLQLPSPPKKPAPLRTVNRASKVKHVNRTDCNAKF